MTAWRERRHFRGKLRAAPIAALVATVAMLGASVGMAFANAANPLPDSHGEGLISGTVQTNADGSIKVLTGNVVVKVGGTWDWGTLSGSSPQSSCDTRYGVGAEVDWSGISTSSSPGVAAFPIKGTNLFFHILDNTMDDVYPFTSPCQHVDAQGFPMGPWEATHTYKT